MYRKKKFDKMYWKNNKWKKTALNESWPKKKYKGKCIKKIIKNKII